MTLISRLSQGLEDYFYAALSWQMLPRRGAGHPGAGPGGVGHQHLAQGGEGAEEVSRKLRQILNHQLQSPEVRRKVLIVTTVGKTQLEAWLCEDEE